MRCEGKLRAFLNALRLVYQYYCAFGQIIGNKRLRVKKGHQHFKPKGYAAFGKPVVFFLHALGFAQRTHAACACFLRKGHLRCRGDDAAVYVLYRALRYCVVCAHGVYLVIKELYPYWVRHAYGEHVQVTAPQAHLPLAFAHINPLVPRVYKRGQKLARLSPVPCGNGAHALGDGCGRGHALYQRLCRYRNGNVFPVKQCAQRLKPPCGKSGGGGNALCAQRQLPRGQVISPVRKRGHVLLYPCGA